MEDRGVNLMSLNLREMLHFSLFLLVHTQKRKTCFLVFSSEELRSTSSLWWNVSAVMTAQECCLLYRVSFGIHGAFLLFMSMNLTGASSSRKKYGCFYDMPLVSGFFLQLLSRLFSSIIFKPGETGKPSCYLRNHCQVSQTFCGVLTCVFSLFSLEQNTALSIFSG